MLGRGPYKIEVMIMGSGATFEDNNSNSIEFDFEGFSPIHENTGQRTGQFSMIISPSWTGNPITVSANIIDLENQEETCGTSNCNPVDDTYNIEWAITPTLVSSCPETLTLVSPTGYGITYTTPKEFKLEASSSTTNESYSGLFIEESFTDIIPINFTFANIRQEWKDVHTDIGSAEEVINFLINAATVAGGGFILDPNNQLTDSYKFNSDFLPFNYGTTLGNAGFKWTHEYSCTSNVLESHDTEFYFSPFAVDLIMTEN